MIDALTALGARGLARLEREIHRESAARDLTYTRDNGKTIVIPLLTTPVVLTPADLGYLTRMIATLGAVFNKTARARKQDPRVRELLPLLPGEEAWLALAPARPCSHTGPR